MAWQIRLGQFDQVPFVLVIIGAVLLHAGCASPTKEQASEPEPVAPVVAALVTDAQASRQQKAYDQAAAQLERALRIEPRNPALWYELARVHLERGSFDQAIQFATKSNALASDGTLRAKNWRLIAEAYSQQGERDRAREAEQKAIAE